MVKTIIIPTATGKHSDIIFSLFSSWDRALFDKLIFAKLVRKLSIF
jgi:hypothetical protein